MKAKKKKGFGCQIRVENATSYTIFKAYKRYENYCVENTYLFYLVLVNFVFSTKPFFAQNI